MIKEYIRQIKLEYKKLFGQKTMYVICALLILISIITPSISINASSETDMYYYGNATMEIDGNIIKANSVLYYNISEYSMKKELAASQSSKAEELSYEFANANLQMAINYNKYIENYKDYKYPLVNEAEDLYKNIFVINHQDEDIEDLLTALKSNPYDEITKDDINKNYLDLTNEEKFELKEQSMIKLDKINNIFESNDSTLYLNYKILSDNEKINSLNESIEQLEKEIMQAPEKEEETGKIISTKKIAIKQLEEIEIPILEYELNNNINLSSDDWRLNAIESKREAMQRLQTLTVVSSDEFNKDQELLYKYSNYITYVKDTERQITQYTNNLFKANSSLKNAKPDVMFAPDGARKHTLDFLNASIAAMFLGMLICGFMIAREFQSGTIRMLVIRPKTRTIIFISKFLMVLTMCIGLYFVVTVVTFITNGFIFGFEDYSNPIYSIASTEKGISFIAYYIPKVLACTAIIYFGCALAIFFSTLSRNIVVGISLPILGILSSMYITEQYLMYSYKLGWAIYTPIPYVYLPKLFLTINSGIRMQPMLGYGVMLLIGCATLLLVTATILFKKLDITN